MQDVREANSLLLAGLNPKPQVIESRVSLSKDRIAARERSLKLMARIGEFRGFLRKVF
jgi:hypothetical protein